MRAAGVICELNPAHNGHAYLLSRMREAIGTDGCVVCLMSGRFVQRGTPALADPYVRAEMALAAGADLVLELPFPWSAGSAETFGRAGVHLLSEIGVEDLAFGSESGDGDRLARAAAVVASPAFGAVYSSLCRQGKGTTVAYATALRQIMGLDGDTDFPASNDLLGIAYLRALQERERAGRFVPGVMVVTRQGSGYRDTDLPESTYPSATALRQVLAGQAYDRPLLEARLDPHMPAGAVGTLLAAMERGEAPIDDRRLMEFYHAYYRLQDPATLEGFAEMGGGMAGHIVRRAKETAGATDFWTALQTKQYPDARLRRALLFGVTGVGGDDLRTKPTYTTLLAANRRGCDYLSAYRSRLRIADEVPETIMVTKPADAPVGRQTDLSERADALFTLCLPRPTAAGELRRRSPVIKP